MFVFHLVRKAKDVIFAAFLCYNVAAFPCKYLIVMGIVANFVAEKIINENHIFI